MHHHPRRRRWIRVVEKRRDGVTCRGSARRRDDDDRHGGIVRRGSDDDDDDDDDDARPIGGCSIPTTRWWKILAMMTADTVMRGGWRMPEGVGCRFASFPHSRRRFSWLDVVW